MGELDPIQSGLSPKLQAALDLISALCDERITPEQFDELDFQVCNDPEIRAFYVEIMHLHAGLYYFASVMSDMDHLPARLGEDETGVARAGMDETMVMPAMTDLAPAGDLTDDLAELFLPSPSIESPKIVKRTKSSWLFKGGIAAILTIGLGLLAHFVPLMDAPPSGQYSKPIVMSARYIASVDVTANPVWDPAGTPLHGANIVVGEPLILNSGAIQLRLHRDGRLVVEGPAEFSFISDVEILVNRGRVAATFPGGGFIVQCPAGTVKDLGTEFGVAVRPDGGTEVEVFKGSVSASSAMGSPGKSPAKGATQPTTRPATEMVLSVGQAANITRDAVTRSAEGAIPQRFIRNLQNTAVSSLDVTDLISGGDGRTHRHHMAVDPLSGEIGDLKPVPRRNGDHLYHRVSGFPVVDGALIPDGTNGPSIIDSAGDKFQFPPTTNATVNHIWTGGKIPWADDQGNPTDLGISTVLSGVDYSAGDHGTLCTHGNNAITLDLDAVRRLYPDRTISRFNCKFGNSFINGWPGSQRINPSGRVFVIVDGVSRYEKLAFTNQDGAIPVDFGLSNRDRFITLAATDDGKDIDREWILWTDAKLSLAVK